MKLLRKILFPIVPVYFIVTWFRNKLYDWGIKSSTSFDFPVICVGNLSVGGTGKTPMIEYLIRLLKDENSLSTLSRGYKRKTKGFQLADENATAQTIGDEPYQLYHKFRSEIQVAVDGNRVNGIHQLRNLEDIPNLILLDDAFQHRKVKAGLYILLTTFDNPYFKDIVLPTGDLREPRGGAQRADIIVVTKCPPKLSEVEKSQFVKRIKPKEGQSVFFSSIGYADEVLSERSKKKLTELDSFTLVTGIANAMPLVDHLKRKGLSFEHLNFKDHHGFTEKDIALLEKKSMILTTEKDFMRLRQYPSLLDKMYYLPISVSIERDTDFNARIRSFVSAN
ncbi:tetraacyldisaccharide 4'-kinase [Hyunsoonleella sp. SJ7]|uniref:Tetraacyldisaccharide 4'-kinase n=1 Tax=Hyunsoonleella aquatilis TaxID=2762758 RepID=A0A923H8G2_9FLAO|nr:tetraacyldisaccharide 4'-kinase [Hyunsoonleella aquatilis]MBC3757339.1 tetraacyldisaccharide 4'-kinase [Hyunsoonleella aquatilis]